MNEETGRSHKNKKCLDLTNKENQLMQNNTTYQVTVIWNTVITTEDWFQEVYSGFVRIISNAAHFKNTLYTVFKFNREKK